MVYLCNTVFGELLSSIRAALKISVEDVWFLKVPTAFYPALYERFNCTTLLHRCSHHCVFIFHVWGCDLVI